VPVGSFYGKDRTYLDPLERKRLRELQVPGGGSGNLPEKSAGNGGGNPGGNGGSKAKGNPKRVPKGNSQSASKAKKAKGGENPAEKENGNGMIQKKLESPFRVLSLRVKPALKLRLGAAFFCSRKKSHARKNPGDSKPPPALPKSPREKAGPGAAAPEKLESGEGRKSLEETEAAGRIPEPREKPEESAGCGNPGEPESRDRLLLPGPSPPEGKKELGSPCRALLYPIFAPAQGSRKRPVDELPSPFGNISPGKALPGSQKSRKAKELSRDSRDQMIIDAGQRRLGAEQCGSCGMLFSAASPEDELQHLRHHRRLLQGLRYQGWKKERVVAEFWDGKIVLILPTDPKYAVRKAEEVRELVDNELGFQQGALRCPEKTRIYLFVSHGKSVVGCLVAEGITQAFRVLPEPGSGSGSGQDSQQPQRAWRCSLDPEPAVCGISRIWVLGSRRRRGIARRMLDALR
ncbi:ESCO2 acetyltransferase, partial [Ptilonorhynchus violaceus]|nr:ESCO2 acetyltransferase [Ptilonorhynchus violaceus]